MEVAPPLVSVINSGRIAEPNDSSTPSAESGRRKNKKRVLVRRKVRRSSRVVSQTELEESNNALQEELECRSGAPLTEVSYDSSAARQEKLEYRSAVVIQRFVRVRMIRLQVERLISLGRKRSLLLHEVLASERSYVQCLVALKREFILPLRQILSDVEVSNVFPGVSKILEAHQKNVKSLTLLIESNGGRLRLQVAQLFCDLAVKIGAVYSPLLNNFSKASIMLKKIMENNVKVAEVVNKCSGRGLTGLTYLQELMITPIQRLPRYEMLLMELVKCSHQLWPDAVALQAALTDIRQVCLRVNESKREADAKFDRSFLEQHASMQVLGEHRFKEKKVVQVHFCDKCEGLLLRKLVKCQDCGERFHVHCANALVGHQSCLQRRRLDLREKQVLFQFEVYITAEEESRFKCSEKRAGGIRVRSAGSELLSQLGTPSMMRIMSGVQPSKLLKNVNQHNVEMSVYAMILLLSDGLSLAYKWVFDANIDAPVIDMICEIPWKEVAIRELDEANSNVYSFIIASNRRGQSSFKFHLKSRLDRQNLVERIETTKAEQLARQKEVSASSKAQLSRRTSVLAESARRESK